MGKTEKVGRGNGVAEINKKNIKAFIQGNYRALLRKFFPDKLPKHIVEQFELRCSLAKECLEQGSCKVCGCATPELFLSDKPCEAEIPCYGPMLSEDNWNEFKKDFK